jgi:hypothetical protein
VLGYTFDTDTLDKITESMKGLQDSTTALEKVLAKHDFPETMAEAVAALRGGAALADASPQASWSSPDQR